MHYSATHTVLTVTGCGTLLSKVLLACIQILTLTVLIASQTDIDFKQDFMLHKPEFAQYTFQYVNSNEVLCILHAESLLSSGK